MEISPKYDLVPYGQGEHDMPAYSPKRKVGNHEMDLAPINRHDLLQRPTLFTHSDRPGNIHKTYDSKRAIQHLKINRVGSQVNIYV